MQAADSVTLVEAEHALLVDPLEGFEVSSVNWRLERQSHRYTKNA